MPTLLVRLKISAQYRNSSFWPASLFGSTCAPWTTLHARDISFPTNSYKLNALSSPQIAPFHVELSVRETGLDFTKLRTAAVSLFTTKRPRDLIALNSNNALLEFLLEGSPEVRNGIVCINKRAMAQYTGVPRELYNLVLLILLPIIPLKRTELILNPRNYPALRDVVAYATESRAISHVS